jgi:lysophospholipid acyltransferase (LPLAT)-like uncharacterized protein
LNQSPGGELRPIWANLEHGRPGWTSAAPERMWRFMWRSIRRSWIVQRLLGLLLSGYMTLILRTTRWNSPNHAVVAEVWAKGGGVIGAFWHSRLIVAMAGWPRNKIVQPPKMLVSLSPDGAFVSLAAEMQGIGVIRGSKAKGLKQKGGTTAFREMLRHLKSGGCMAMTPDGPRGPRMRAGIGAIQLAKLSGAPILLFAWSTKRRIIFNSWDRFVMPLPFDEGYLLWGGPMSVPANATSEEMEQLRAQLERDLINLTQEADKLAGGEICQPADPNERRRRRNADAGAVNQETLG